MTEKIKGRLILLVVYILSFEAGFLVAGAVSADPLRQSAAGLAAAVAVIFLFSRLFNNSSVFDPYWSVAPPLTFLWYLGAFDAPATLRSALILGLTSLYGIRLTWNFLRGWPGLSHEDWRYADFRISAGKGYWLVSLAGIHFFPALMVFGGTLSLWVAASPGGTPFNWIDGAAALVTGLAIGLEALADRQLRQYVLTAPDRRKTMDRGLWALSRHPNYLGEILFWWGLYLFALAAAPQFWWVGMGPLAITLMFLFISIPMIEKRMMKRRSDYAAYRERTSRLIPMTRSK